MGRLEALVVEESFRGKTYGTNIVR